MTSEQHARWRDFAMRMAALPSRTPPTKWVEEMVEWWFGLHDHPKYDVADVTSWDQGEALVCDRVAEFLWDRVDEVMCRRRFARDETRDRAEEKWLQRWGGAVSCCIRAGLDVVAEPSVGVLGFTVGDLRRMYPEGLPGWVTDGFELDGKPVDLSTAPDGMGVWL